MRSLSILWKTVGLIRYKFLMFCAPAFLDSSTGQTNERDPNESFRHKTGGEFTSFLADRETVSNYIYNICKAHGRKFGLDGFAVIDHIQYIHIHPTTSKLRQKVTSQSFSQVALWPRCRYARSTGGRTCALWNRVKRTNRKITKWHMTHMTCIHFTANKLLMFKNAQKAVKAKPLQRCTTPKNVWRTA